MREGKLVEGFVVSDQLAFARQIGLVPPGGFATGWVMKSAFRTRTRIARRLKRERQPA